MLDRIGITSLFVFLTVASALAGAHAELPDGLLPLERQLREQFPSIVLDSNGALEPAQESVAGRMLVGMRTGVPLRGGLRVFYPASYNDAFVVESGNQRVALRAVGAHFSQSATSAGKVFYTSPHDWVDAMEISSTGRSEELLLLHDERAARVFEYEIVEMRGVAGLSVQNGAILFAHDAVDVPTIFPIALGRFTTPLPSIQIDRPWVIDAEGKRSETSAHWTIVEEKGQPTRIRLTVRAEGLVYPLIVDPSFSSIGNMGAARSNHTATLLPNGKVLIAGGVGLNTAELYDPATGVFTPTGAMSVPRYSHTATLLPNGRVLVAGGSLASFVSSRDTAELYDPATGTFTPTANMNGGHDSHTATLLPNGKVLIAGGANGFASVATAELFDPNGGTNGTFTLTGTMTASRSMHTATLLPNGKVLLAGGFASFNALGSAELFDPAAGTNGAFTATANLKAARTSHTATVLTNGQVLLAGGNGATLPELFDPAAGSFTFATANMTSIRSYHTATLLANGKVLFTGGKSGSVLATAEVYDPAGGIFAFQQTSAPMSAARYNHTATLLPNGVVLIAGGYNDVAYLNTAELYDPAGGTPFTATGPAIQSGRILHTSTLLPDGKVLIAGGQLGSTYISSAELYDSATGTYASTAGNTVEPLGGQHTATLLPSGKVLIAGGLLYLNTAELYDPVAGTFASTNGTMTSTRVAHTATLLPNGTVLIAGGYGSTGRLNTAELYDPAAGTFTPTRGTMISVRMNHTATLLLDGTVLLTGGLRSDGVNTDSAELYDPASETFTAIADPMNDPRWGHTATLLSTGTVLIVGGYDSDLVDCDLYDPVTKHFSPPSGSVVARRRFHTATLLPNGQVLIAGGQNTTPADLNTAELYNPVTRAFTATSAPMTTSRDLHTATLLPNGKVLLDGGAGSSSAEAELYDPGLGYSDARRPVVSSLTDPLCQPANLSLSGSLMDDSEGSSGSTNNSASNAPLLRLQRIDSEQFQFAFAQSFSASSFFSSTLSNLPSGRYRAAIVSGAVPSIEQIIDVETTPLLGSYVTATVNLSGSTIVSPSSLPAGYNGVFYPQSASAAGFTGTLTVNGSTGAVIVTNAGPAGDYTITVSSSTGCGSPTSTFVLKVIGLPSSVSATGGTPQSAQVNSSFATALQAKVTDSAGHPLSNVAVNFVAPSSGASSTFSGGGSAFTNASGIASITATANGVTGRYNVTAVVGGLNATFDLSNISPGTPSNVVATAQTPTSVLITWNGTVVGATYEVQRHAAGNVSSTVGSSASGSLTDTLATANTAYLYEVREISPAVSTYGTADLATTVIFTDPSLPLGNLATGIKVKATHFTQLRTAVDAVRTLAGLGAGSYTDPTLTGGTTTVKRLDLTELRAALDAARTTLLLPADTYARAAIVAATTSISAGDLNELRGGVR